MKNERFRELLEGLTGQQVIKGRTVSTDKLERKHSQLELAKWVSTTADMWTEHGCSFLGIKYMVVECSLVIIFSINFFIIE